MTESRNHLVGRPDWSRRLLLGSLGAVFGVLAVWGIAIGNRVAGSSWCRPSPVLRPWVAPRNGQAFYLRMVNDLGSRGTNPGPVVFVEQLPTTAEQAGASLVDETGPRSAPPSDAAPFFSA